MEGYKWQFQLSHQKHKWLQMYKLLTSNYVLLLTSFCLCSTLNYFWLFRKESAWDAVKLLLIIKNNWQTGVWSKYLLSMLSSVLKPGSVTYWKTHARLLVIALTDCLMILSCFSEKIDRLISSSSVPRCNGFFWKVFNLREFMTFGFFLPLSSDFYYRSKPLLS